MEQNKALNLLGLVNRAGKLVSGSEEVVKAIQKKQVYLVIISIDASDNTKKMIIDKCIYYNVPYKILFEGEQLGHSIGKASRKVIAITDKGFVSKFKNIE